MRINKISPIVLFCFITHLMPLQVFAQQHRSPLLQNRDQQSLAPTSEFVFRNDADEVLVPVYLLGAVAKPGLYHIPPKTDLVHLMALSGGPLKEANLEQVVLRRPSTNEVKELDFNKIVHSRESKPLGLMSNDVLMVDVKEPSVSNNTLLAIGLVSSIVSIIVSGFVVKQALQKK